jgi:hypothetical protein
MSFAVLDGRITEIDILLDPVRLGRVDLAECLLSKILEGKAVDPAPPSCGS